MPPDMPLRSTLRPLLLRWVERWWPWARQLDAATLRADALAAPLAALLVLPQAIAFAALAGLPPAWGLYSAVVPTVVAALAGSSRHVLTGPTNAMSVALAASLAPLAVAGSGDYLQLALLVTLMVGLVQLAVALLRLGTLANFIAPSVLLGFTSGAAVLIAWHALQSVGLGPLTQLPWAAAQPGGTPHGAGLMAAGATVLPAEVSVALVTLVVAVALRHPAVTQRVGGGGPALLVGLVVGSLFGAVLRQATAWPLLQVGALPSAWPPLTWPQIDWADVPRLAGIALALTIVALGQSMAIAKALATRSGQPLDANRECLGQGLANTIGAFFSCFVTCGSLNRSVPHMDAGARTPLSAVMAAALLLAGVAVAAPLLAQVPLAAVSALLLVVAWTLVDRAQWRELVRLDQREAGVAAGTLLATLLLPLEVAVLSGVAASLVLYLYRSAHPALRRMGFAGPPTPGALASARPFVVLGPGAPECPQLTMLRMEGTVFFGAVAHVADGLTALRHAPEPARHLLVMSKSMNFIDVAGAALWEDERRRREAMGGGLYFHRPRPEVLALWHKSGFIQRLGVHHLFADKRSAIAAIVPRLDGHICAGCRARVFEECARQPGAGAP